MADVADAYRFLNDSLQLGLSPEVLTRGELRFKMMFAQRKGIKVSARTAQNWEFFCYLTPRMEPEPEAAPKKKNGAAKGKG